ncbi:hypothetical protein H9I45_02590 [Polaribacter haliotis]|uniref:Uncharacterized protein n=1 Tax=Polaribacter haliotis TaxID=1888915 RepID=A0A7L8AHF4_9FLAO|nr:hypothetical protein [Polaribacter haliotis]QOD61354.1 hypothetical protein H9I45_02590 [Polaribacter haliotis]
MENNEGKNLDDQSSKKIKQLVKEIVHLLKEGNNSIPSITIKTETNKSLRNCSPGCYRVCVGNECWCECG